MEDHKNIIIPFPPTCVCGEVTPKELTSNDKWLVARIYVPGPAATIYTKMACSLPCMKRSLEELSLTLGLLIKKDNSNGN